MRDLWDVLKQTLAEWQDDRVPRLGAALAYYSLFSLAPVLIIAVAFAGEVYGPVAAQGKMADQLETLVGRQVADGLQELTKNAHFSRASTLATMVSGVLLLVGATGAVVALKDALNTVWGIAGATGDIWWVVVRDRLQSLGLVLGTGMLLVGSVVLTSFLQGMSERVLNWLGLSFSTALIVNWTVSIAVVTLLFAMIYRILPDIEIRWRDVWIGSAVTSVLFLIGRELIAVYLGRFSFASTYGTAGSLVAILLWIYYSAQIFLLGAEFTQVYASRCGVQIKPSRGARLMDEAERQQAVQKSKRRKKSV
ncbi:MAG TPA: YihY/virulence factor BrkB family protein [Pirellulales bacterium]|jgi:membrane protein|nr:YihY/virulence factor BrkB family protein [Pirellulales bacterium]